MPQGGKGIEAYVRHALTFKAGKESVAERDSNSRYPCRYSSFQNLSRQPLGHLSEDSQSKRIRAKIPNNKM